MDLDYIFKPSSVAVIGASSDTRKWGGTLLKNIIEGGFKGHIYPINPKGGEILGLKAYPSVLDIPGPVDLAVIGIPASQVVNAARDCAAKGVKGLIIITAGFAEINGEGIEREKELAEVVKSAGMRMVGPNCFGISNAEIDLNALPLSFTRGSVAFLSQSGNTTIDIEYLVRRRGLGFNKIIAFGNQTDIRLHEYMSYVANDTGSKVVLIYMESVKDGARFLETAKTLTRKKPVVVIKAGGTKTGSRAARSHTAALATKDAIYDAAFKQSGIIRVSDPQDLIDTGQTMANLPSMNGNRIAVLADGGGHAAMACDAVDRLGLEVPTLRPEIQAKLREVLMPQSITLNPVDFAGAAEADLWNFTRCSEILLRDEDMDGLLIVGTLFGWYTASLSGEENLEIDVARSMCELAAKYKKPVILHCPYPAEEVASLREFNRGGIPVYSRVETAVRCIAALSDYGRYLQKVERVQEIPASSPKKIEQVKRIIAEVRKSQHSNPVEPEAMEVFKAYNVPLPKAKLSKNIDEAAAVAREIGYPVVAKVVSPDIVHKSDAGCVKINLNNEGEVKSAYSAVMIAAKKYNKEASIQGVLISEMKPEGTEVIIGATRDREFGPVVTFGLGGVFVEMLEDVAFRVAPLTQSEAYDMVHEIKGLPILKGIRGKEPADIEAIINVIMEVSRLMLEHPEIEELDLNPILVYPKGVIAVDARIIVTKSK